MLNINNKKIVGLFVSIALAMLLCITCLFGGNVSFASAETPLSAKDVASKINADGSSIVYFDNQSSKENYIGSLHMIFSLAKTNYVSDYEYGGFVMLNEDYEGIKNDSYSKEDYIAKLEELDRPYASTIYEDGYSYSENSYYYFIYNMNFTNTGETPEEREKVLDKEYVFFVYVKDNSTNESFLSEPSVVSYNSVNDSDTVSNYYKELYESVEAENSELKEAIQSLKKEIDTLKTETTSNSTIVKIVSISLGSLLLVSLFIALISPKKKKNKK